MNEHQSLVRDFHKRFGLTINDTPTLSPADDILRVNLIHEEAMELWAAERDLSFASQMAVKDDHYLAMMDDARFGIADALGDLAYVIYGAGVTYGLELVPNLVAGSICPNYIPSLNAEMAIELGAEDGSLPTRPRIVQGSLNTMLGCVEHLAASHAIPLDPVFREIHRSNMSKLWTDVEVWGALGGWPIEMIYERDAFDTDRDDFRYFRRVEPHGAERPWVARRNDGKILKSPSYSPANLRPILSQ